MPIKLTDKFDHDITQFLVKSGIKHDIIEGRITIDRTSMVQTFPLADEHASYEAVKTVIRGLCGPTAYVTWGGRTDDWLGVEVYLTDVEAR